MRPLSESDVIGADAGILAFVRDADRHPLRLVVSGREISGLVSLSDLQRLPVRAALFAMVTHLEMVMTDAIRREFNSTDDWMGRLSAGRRTKVQNEIAEARKGDGFVETLLFTQFKDKVTIIHKSSAFKGSKTRFEADLCRAQALRDKLAHANEYAATRPAACKVSETVRLIDKWIGQLSKGSEIGAQEPPP